MKRLFFLTFALVLAQPLSAEIRYRGTLYSHGEPANGPHTLRITPYVSASSALPLTTPIVLNAISINEGRLEASLEFGEAVARLDEVWLQVEAAAIDGEFYRLPERQRATVKAAGACWSTSGNSGTDPTSEFIGTTDGNSLSFRVNGTHAATISPSGIPGPPNVLFGSGTLSSDAVGTFAAGSGNGIGGDGAVVAGVGNSAGTPLDTTDAASHATVLGGTLNRADGLYSTVVGGNANAAIGRASLSAGERTCAGAQNSVALGKNATVRPGNAGPQCPLSPGNSGNSLGDHGSFVWSGGPAFTSSGSNQFLIHAAGGVGINTSNASLLGSTDLALKGNGTPANFLMISGETPAAGVSEVAHRFVSNGKDTIDSTLTLSREVHSFGTVKTNLAEFGPTGRLRVFADGPVKPTAGGWSAPSDRRLKRDIAPLPSGTLDRLLSLHAMRFKYREDAPSEYYVPGEHIGFVAQDVEKVFPGWVSRDEAGYRLVGAEGFEALVVEALRELRSEQVAAIDVIKREHASEVATLKQRIDQMQRILVTLEDDSALTVPSLAAER